MEQANPLLRQTGSRTDEPRETFDLAQLAADIRREHENVIAGVRQTVEAAIRCGELLHQVKAELPHGEWGRWLAENFPASQRTAQQYLQLAERAEDARPVAHLGLRRVLAELAEPKKSAREPHAAAAPEAMPPVHWALDLIPPMPANQRSSFERDIAERGCMVPVVYADGGILLDGRERLRACRKAGIEPPRITYRGLSDSDCAAYVLSLNVLGRSELRADSLDFSNLTPRQRWALEEGCEALAGRARAAGR